MGAVQGWACSLDGMASWLIGQGRLAGRAEAAVSLAKRAGLAATARALSRGGRANLLVRRVALAVNAGGAALGWGRCRPRLGFIHIHIFILIYPLYTARGGNAGGWRAGPPGRACPIAGAASCAGG